MLGVLRSSRYSTSSRPRDGLVRRLVRPRGNCFCRRSQEFRRLMADSPFRNLSIFRAKGTVPNAGAREVLLVRAAHGAYPRSKRLVGPLTPRVRSVRGSDNTSLDPALRTS